MPETVRFDHYEVLTRDDGSLFELGRGAMGVTYKAFDTNLRMPVCLKVIAANHLHSDIARQRFIREARSAARLRNPNVAAVYHLGLEGDTWFYAMEFIDGETVDALIKRNGPLPPRLALEIVDQVAKALGGAEPHGLVHRDIKPANLMVIREGDQVLVKVIDFGLAKSSLPDDESATLSMGGFVGTPHFASPEQLEEKDLDVRSDIYSLGVTLWFMLAGRTPFAGSMAQVMSQHLSKTPPFEKLNVPPPLARLLRRMLEKKALDRPQNSAELRKEVARCLSELDSPDAIAAGAEPLAPRDVQESFLTMVDPALVEGTAVRFAPGELVAARYRIVEALGDSNLGRVYRAQDQTRAHDVRLVVLHEALTLSTEAMSALERMIELLTPRPHPNVQRIDALETVEGMSFLVLEWCEGASLVEVLRARRELPASEVLTLLAPAAAGLDHVLACGVDETEIALHRVMVAFARKPEADWLHQSVALWPDFAIKISALSRRGAESAGETLAGAQTMVDAPRAGSGGAAGRAVRSLGAVAYELLGGKLSPAALATGMIDFKPLAGLGEAGNEVLRRALQPEPPFLSATAFMKALTTPETVDFHRRDHFGTASPTRSAGTRAAVETLSTPGVEHPTVNVPRKSWGLITAAAIVMVAGALGYWWTQRNTRVAEVPPIADVTPVPPATPAPSEVQPEKPAMPTPPPGPSQRELLDRAVADAKRLEAEERWPECVTAWVKVVKDFPGSPAVKANLEAVCGTLRARPNGLDPEVFAKLQEPLTEAANLGTVSAMMVLGENLRRKAPADALKWFGRAGELGDLEGLTQAGLMTADGSGLDHPDGPKAVKMFEAAAEKGHASAQLALGECYLRGKAGLVRDEKLAVEWLQKAAAAKNGPALDLLATCYDHGQGVEKDHVKAAELFQQAIEAHYLPSLGNLGILYIKGEGVKEDKKRAFALIQQGAKAKDRYCIFLAAQCYETGTGTSPNPQLARDLYVEAAEAGEPHARQWCEKNKVNFQSKSEQL